MSQISGLRLLESNICRAVFVVNTDRGLRTMKRSALIIFTILIFLLTGFSQNLPLTVDGLWQADGYGLLVEVQGPKILTFQTTSISCLEWWTAQRSVSNRDKNEAVFLRGDTEIRISPSSSPNKLQMREGRAISYVTLSRIAARPATCNAPLENTPLNNYRVFWHTFAEQFALFPNYKVDWAAVDRKYQPRVTSSTTPEELYDIIREMILPFHNAHTSIGASSISRRYLGYRSDSAIGRRFNSKTPWTWNEIFKMVGDQTQRSKSIIESRYASGPLRPYVNDKIDFGMLKNSVGYMRILGFDEYTKDGTFEEGAAALEEALDQVFNGAKQMKGLVIDVRLNTGGSDPLALAIASRLASKRYLAYSKTVRTNVTGLLRFSTPQNIWVETSTRHGYLGTVVLLFGPDTISGGETFAMALMGRNPRVTFVGENTQGVFSDVWGRKLPNGWTFRLPTELYLTSSGKSFDVKGMTPNIRVPVFPEADLKAGRDGALERAIKVILP